MPALGFASCKSGFWNRRLRDAASKRNIRALAPAVALAFAFLLVADVSLARVTRPRANASAAPGAVAASRCLACPALWLPTCAMGPCTDITVAATTPTTPASGAGQWRRSAASVWARPTIRGQAWGTCMAPHQRSRSSANAPLKRLPERACQSGLARAGLPPFPPLLPAALPPRGTISDSTLQATDFAYLTLRAARGDLTPHGPNSVTARWHDTA